MQERAAITGKARWRNMTEQPPPEPKRPDPLTRLAGGAVLLLTLVGGGAITGVLAKTARDDRLWLIGAFVVAIAACTVWGLSVFPEHIRLERIHPFLLPASLTLAVVAALAVMYALVDSQGIRGKPSITASVSTGTNQRILRASIHEVGLPSGATLSVEVDLLARLPEKQRVSAYPFGPPTQLYVASVGPNADGDANLNLSLPFDPRGSDWLVVSGAVDGSGTCAGIRRGTNQTVSTPKQGCVIVNLKPHRSP
jgi:hypothetical protein